MIKVSKPFSGIPPLFSDLAKSLVGEMDCSLPVLTSFSTDNSPYSIKPQAVIYPKNATDIKHVLSFAREYGIPVTVCGNGNGTTGGSLGEGIIINMARYFTQIQQINMMEHTITVGSGVSIKELRETLHGLGMDIPVLTAQDNDSTIGAFVSTKSCTATSFHAGTIRDWVEALTCIVDTGEEHKIADGITPSGRLLGIYQTIFPILTEEGPILRAVKPETSDDASGYCLWNTSIGPRQLLDQIVGGEGTLGIITSITLRLSPYKPHTFTVCIPFPTTELLQSCIEISKYHKAEHIFLYDSTFIELAERYHINSIPSFKEASYTLCVSFFSTDEQILKNITTSYVRALPAVLGKIVSYEESSFIDHITNPYFLNSLLSSYTKDSHIKITTCDGIIVPLRHYKKIVEDLEKYLYSTGKLHVISGNAGSGHLSVITLFDPQSPGYEKEIDNYTQTVFNYVKKYKGGISAQGGEGIARSPYLPYIYNQTTIDIFTNIKKAWDPLFILNPGKKLGTTLTYLNNHAKQIRTS